MNYHFVHVAGDTLDQQITVGDYPSSAGWTLKYYLTARFSAPTQAQIVLTAIANADGTYQLQASPTDTAAWQSGAYSWRRHVEKVGARQTLTSSDEEGEILVRANHVGLAQGADNRSHAKKMVELIETAIAAFGPGSTIKSYAIGTRQVTKADVPELLVLRDRYRWEAANEDAAADIAGGKANPRNVGIRFGRP
jgi:hypothetical protein